MKRVFVLSTALRSVGYDAENLILEIEFVSGGVYQYEKVPLGEFRRLMSAPSKGRFVDDEIKGHFSYRRVDTVGG